MNSFFEKWKMEKKATLGLGIYSQAVIADKGKGLELGFSFFSPEGVFFDWPVGLS
jgi:hypothetical protein